MLKHCVVMVAMASPAIPNGGMMPYPKTNNGLRTIFKKKLIIKIFL